MGEGRGKRREERGKRKEERGKRRGDQEIILKYKEPVQCVPALFL
jgi:hypothetical protein